eukprot:358299-Chlamydomonas_euryale.AAC.2
MGSGPVRGMSDWSESGLLMSWQGMAWQGGRQCAMCAEVQPTMRREGVGAGWLEHGLRTHAYLTTWVRDFSGVLHPQVVRAVIVSVHGAWGRGRTGTWGADGSS